MFSLTSGVAARTSVLFAMSALAMTTAGWVTLAPASASADPTMCDGQAATIVATADDQTITGTDGPDVISTAGHLDVDVLAGGGDDLVCTDGGNNPNAFPHHAARGGPGDDTLIANSTPDRYYDAAILDGGAGDDILEVDAGPAELLPGAGDDVMHLPAALTKGRPASYVVFDEHLPGVNINVPRGTIDGEGHDTFTGAVGFTGTEGADIFKGGPGPDSFYSDSGYDSAHPATDVLRGRGGDDQLMDFHATIDGGAGNDSLQTTRGVVTGGTGRDHIELDEGGRADGGPGADVIKTSVDVEDPPRILLGSFTLNGGSGADAIFLASAQGEGGPFRCDGPGCRFHVDGGPGSDLLSFQRVGGRVHLDLSQGRGTFFGAHLTVGHIDQIEGSPFADLLEGTAHADHLDGNGGPDRLVGRGGPDVLHGGMGHDVAIGGPGQDQCLAEVRRSC